jgi:hypothetical protein
VASQSRQRERRIAVRATAVGAVKVTGARAGRICPRGSGSSLGDDLTVSTGASHAPSAVTSRGRMQPLVAGLCTLMEEGIATL